VSEGLDVAIDSIGKARVPVEVEATIARSRGKETRPDPLDRCLLLVPMLKGGLGTFCAVGSLKA